MAIPTSLLENYHNNADYKGGWGKSLKLETAGEVCFSYPLDIIQYVQGCNVARDRCHFIEKIIQWPFLQKARGVGR